MGRACSMHWGYEKCIQNFILKREGKKPLIRPGHKGEDYIKIDLRRAHFDHLKPSQ
jgi:hypothetical protein